MKSTGIVRKIDELGRITLPSEVRRAVHLDTKDPVEIFLDKDTVVLKKFSNSCVFCSSQDDLALFEGKSVCLNCLKKLKQVVLD